MLFMVIERFKNRDPKPIYERLREGGRSMPDGLRHTSTVGSNPTSTAVFSSWSVPTRSCCSRQWIAGWRDLVEFEIVPVCPSKDIRALFGAG